MADKIKFELPKFLLYSDNTYVSPSTLPVGPVSKGPNLARGREEYNKGNYTDSDAQAYAKKISGKAETISPEFDFIGGFGVKQLLNKTPLFASRSGFFKNIIKRSGNTDFKYTGNRIHYKRVKNGSYKNLGLTKEETNDVLDILYDNTINLDNYKNPVELAKELNISLTNAKAIFSDKGNMFFFPLKKSGDGLIFYRGKNIDQNTFNYLLPHEVHHGLSFKAFGLRGAPIDIPKVDKKGFYNQAEKEGIRDKDKYFKYMTEDGGEEMASRGVQLKDELNIINDRPITPKELKTLSETYPKKFNNNMEAFFKLIGNNYEEWAKWLSSAATMKLIFYPNNIKIDEEQNRNE